MISLIGTMIGASIGVILKKPSNRILGFILGFAGGLMLAIVVFELIPDCIKSWDLLCTMLFCIIGILITLLIDSFFSQKNNINMYGKVAFMTAFGLMIHNFPEGIIMGAGFLAGQSLGIKMSIIIAIHDIPEGMAVAAPLMVTNVKPGRILFYVLITALPTVLGAWIGIFTAGISKNALAICLAVASGIMLYTVCGELLPESSKVWSGTTTTLGSLIGILLGLFMINVL
jgi:ZIP family zinc transporter